MASRKFRAGYSTELRNKIKDAKKFYTENSPDFKFNTVEHMFIRTTGIDSVASPWPKGPTFQFSTTLGKGRIDDPSAIPFDLNEINDYIQETAKALQLEMGINDLNIQTTYGVLDGSDPDFAQKGINRVHGAYYHGDQHINLNLHEMWDTVKNNNKNNLIPKKEINLLEDYKEQLRSTLAHEMRHKWQYTTEGGKPIIEDQKKYDNGEKIENYKKKYKNKTKKHWKDDFKKYWGEPTEVDARKAGKKYRTKKQYNKVIKNYKEKLEQDKVKNEDTQRKIKEIEERSRARRNELEILDPVEWDIDTGNNAPTGKHDVSRNTRYKNAKLNKGQKNLRPRVTQQGNSIDFDSVYNYNAPHRTTKKPKKKYQSNSRTFQADDGSTVKQYLDRNGNIKAQVRTWSDGRREVRRQHSAETIAKDPMAKNMSAVTSIYDGETTEIHRRPNGDYYSTTKINHQTGEIETTYNKRRNRWGGGVSERQTVTSTVEEEKRKYNERMNKKYGLEDVPEPEPYTPKVGDNIIRGDDHERFVLTHIDEADPSLDIYNNTYHYESPNGERMTSTKPIDPTKPDGGYWLDDEVLNGDDVNRINNTFKDLELYTDQLSEAQDNLNALKDRYAQGTADLDEVYQAEKGVRFLEEKVANTKYQIELDDQKFNSPNSSNHGYLINERTQKYMDKAEGLLVDYRSRKHKNIEDVFKENIPRQTIDTIEAGFDNAINVSTKNTVKGNINKRRRTVTGPTTGRGNRKINTKPTRRGMPKGSGQSSTGTGRRRIKKSGTVGRGGKATKLKPVGKNGKVLSSIPRKGVPLTKKQLVKTAANLVVNSAATNTASTIIKNAPTPNIPNIPNTPTPNNTIPNTPNVPNNNTPNTPNNNTPNNNVPNTPSNNFSPNYDPNDPTTWTDADIDEMAQGDPHYEDALRRQRQQAINALNTGNPNAPNYDPNDPASWTDEDIAKIANGDPELANDLIKLRDDAKKGILPNGPINKIGPGEYDPPPPNTPHIDAPDTELEGFDTGGKLGKLDMLMTGINIIGAIGDYKEARREGHGVVSSAIKTGAKFAIEEALGWWSIPIGIVKTVPGLAIKGADMLYKENRRMNSAANFQVFGNAQFMDTQQLATMRQSGMEMAKMSQYNLQQTLMGNEANYLHR